ncbi:hypothetical protein [Paucibacter soli]|uniref:hypothetical protein n=1 Tax=Paucibacter soli TaxID=3133433 RepID=UPI0030965107
MNSPTSSGRHGRKKPQVRGSGAIKIKRPTANYSIVPDSILVDGALSLDARLVLAYLAGRPANWTPLVSDICGRLKVTDWGWRRIRRELIAAGVMRHTRESRGYQQLEWVLEVDLERYFS